MTTLSVCLCTFFFPSGASVIECGCIFTFPSSLGAFFLSPYRPSRIDLTKVLPVTAADAHVSCALPCLPTHQCGGRCVCVCALLCPGRTRCSNQAASSVCQRSNRVCVFTQCSGVAPAKISNQFLQSVLSLHQCFLNFI